MLWRSCDQPAPPAVLVPCSKWLPPAAHDILVGMRSAAKAILAARKMAGLTQAELACAAGTSQPAISRYEQGSATPSKGTLERILRACSERKPRPSELLVANRDRVIKILRGHGATKVLVFGSVARGEDDEHSDIDLLVDHFDQGAYSWGVPKAQRELEDLLGVKVDVGEIENMRRPVLIEALREARAL